MGRLAEMQRKLLEVSHSFLFRGSQLTNKPSFRPLLHLVLILCTQQMMGPEAMGVANQNLVWSDDKVCRNFLCGVCPHALFTNTVYSQLHGL